MEFHDVDPMLIGRDRRRTVNAVALAIGLSLLSFGLGMFFGTTLASGSRSSVLLVVAGVFVLFLLAVLNAFENDGLLVSWALVFAPLYGWILHIFYFTGMEAPSLGVVSVVEGLLVAAFATVTLGTLGYVAGDEARRWALGNSTMNTSPAVRRLLAGVRPATTKRFLVFSFGLFLAVFGAIAGLRLFGVSLPWASGANSLLWAGAVVGLVGFTGVHSYYNEGLLVTWVLVFEPLFGALLLSVAPPAPVAGLLDPSIGGVIYVIALSVPMAIVIGTLGFVIGYGTRWLVDHGGSAA